MISMLDLGRARAAQDLRAHDGRILGAWIVIGDDEQVAAPGRGRAHHRSLAPIPVATGADQADRAATAASGGAGGIR